MTFSTWLLFSGIALVSTISPGPAVLLSISNSLTHGVSKSILSSLGNISGIFIVSGAAAMGLGAILKTSVLLFTVLKIGGAIYLIYLGIRQWRTKETFLNSTPETKHSTQGIGKSYLQGLLVALSNPKVVLFFTALFPQFLDVSKPLVFQFAILTSTFMVFSFLALVCYAMGAHAFKGWFSRGNRAVWFNRISGMVFVAFGLGILRIKHKTT